MKHILISLFVLIAVFTTACKKSTLTKKINNTTWQLKQVQVGDKDVTAETLNSKKVYQTIAYANDGNHVIFSNPTSSTIKLEEAGEWKLEKIVPTVGDSYYLVRNIIDYSYERRKFFNVGQYGSEVILTNDNLLTQTNGDYTITYEKVN